ncbi:MAG TPA: ABC transporter substrate-binding protein [Candidatus Binataceae bacterium]|nr:ABC transporter substrate-binding protein [Candidatus Binataceae bacterium]
MAEHPSLRRLLALTILVAVSAGCHIRRPTDHHERDQILYSNVGSDPRTFNPLLVTDAGSGAALGNLFEGLVRINPETTLPEPNLAQSWEIARDGKSIVFHLRHGVKWQDGAPFTAHDVVFTLRAIYDPRVPNSERSTLLVDGQPIVAQALDDYTVRMTMARPFAPLLYAVGFDILPAHILEPALKAGKFTQTWAIDTPPAKIVGLGSFELTRYVQAQYLQFARNSDYWMRAPDGSRLPRLHGETDLIIQDHNAAYLRFLSGQLDVYDPLPEEVLDLHVKAAGLGVTLRQIGLDTGSLFFAFNRNPRHFIHDGVTDPRLRWFTDLNFMRALAHLVDKQGMINLVFHGLGKPAISDISPENKVFHNPNLSNYTYDPKLAARLLDEAGYRLIAPHVRADPQGHPLIFNLITNAGNPSRDQICIIFKQDLANVGITVNYRPLEFTTLVDKLDTTFDWDCVLIGFTGTIDPNDGSNFYRSSGNLHLWDPNEPHPATPWEAEIDRLLDQGASEMDVKKRALYYWRIQQILHDQLPIIETVRQEEYSAYKNALENYRPTVWGLYQPEYIQFRAQ